MEIDPAALSAKERYKLAIGLVAPRPIAWVSTRGADGSLNLAPMSYFNAMQASPFIVLAIGVGSRQIDGQVVPKDTLRNALETREFVVNVVSEDLAEAMNSSSGDHPYGVSEWDHAGIEPAASTKVAPPRVARAPAAFECRLFEALPLTRSRTQEPIPHSVLLLGEVVHVHVADGVLDERLNTDITKLAPVARLGGPYYAKLGEVFRMDRPQVGEPAAD